MPIEQQIHKIATRCTLELSETQTKTSLYSIAIFETILHCDQSLCDTDFMK